MFPDKPLTGMTPKFECDLGKDDEVKVKYGEKNGEVYAEVAASRLLWALGFQADVMYPTKVTCRYLPGRSVCGERRRLEARQSRRQGYRGLRPGGDRARKRQRG